MEIFALFLLTVVQPEDQRIEYYYRIQGGQVIKKKNLCCKWEDQRRPQYCFSCVGFIVPVGTSAEFVKYIESLALYNLFVSLIFSNK